MSFPTPNDPQKEGRGVNDGPSRGGTEPTLSRPHVPAGYGISPGIGASLSWQQARERLAAARNYWVASTRPDGRPHVMPVWGLWLGDALYFSTARGSRKGRNLAANPKVAVHLESGDDVVVLEGAVEEVRDPALLQRFTDAYDAKYQIRPDTADAANITYALRPRAAFTWQERDFPESAARWQFGND